MKDMKEFYLKERNRAEFIINKIYKKDWGCLPPEYEKDPERAIKHFEEEIKYFEEQMKK